MSNFKKTLLNSTFVLTIAASSAAFAAPALADSSDDKISKLEMQVNMLMSEIQNLKKSQANIDQQVSKAVSKKMGSLAPAAGGSSSDVKITMKPSPKFESADGSFVFQPFGRVHADATFIQDDQSDFADGTNFRRARIGAKGQVAEDWKYKFEMDFGGEATSIKDIFITYSGFEAVDLKIGHFKPFTGLEQRTSSNYITFAERSGPTNTFTRGQRMGVAAYGGGDNFSASLGVFGEDAGNNTGADDEGWSTDARVTIAPIAEKGRVLHVGAAGSYRTPDGSATTLRLRTRPQTGNGARIIDTVAAITGVDNTLTWSGEVLGIYDGLTVQGEYFRQSVDRTGVDADFDGWYAMASYLLTGESRPYKASSGLTGRVSPKNPFSLKNGTWGAWEIAARVANTDLNDTGAGITGGEMDEMTFGLNWYAQKHLRFMANYSMIDTDNNAITANDDPNVITIRAQVDF